MTISKKQKQILKDNLDVEYLAKEHTLQIKLAEEIDKAEKDRVSKEEAFNRKVQEIRIAAINDEIEKSKQERTNKYKNEVDDLYKNFEFLMKSADEQNEILKNLKITYDNDILKIDQNADKKKIDEQKKVYQDEIALLTAKDKILSKDSQAYWDNALQIEDKAWKSKLLGIKKGSKEEELINKEHAQNLKNIDQQSFDGRVKLFIGYFDEIEKLSKGLQSIAEGDKETQKMAIRIQEAATIGKLVLSDISAIRKAYTESPLTFGLPWSAFYAADMVIGAVAANQAANKSISALDASTTGGSSSNPMAGRQAYGDGGIIGGRRHAAGGTMIEAEQGEAIMTRGAVTMFQPLLSQLNQLGGGTAFSANAMGMARQDRPKYNNPQNTQVPIIKTYVVASEMQSMAHKQSRLKDLSTI